MHLAIVPPEDDFFLEREHASFFAVTFDHNDASILASHDLWQPVCVLAPVFVFLVRRLKKLSAASGGAPQQRHDDPGTGLHAMAATVAQTYGNPDGNESDEEGNGRAPGTGGSTGGSTGVAVHSGPAAGGGAPAARPGGNGARTSMWSGRGRSLQVRGRGYGRGGARGQGRGGSRGRARPGGNGTPQHNNKSCCSELWPWIAMALLSCCYPLSLTAAPVDSDWRTFRERRYRKFLV